jgi:hypothetical protein
MTAEGPKVPVGLWLGDTESPTVANYLRAKALVAGVRKSSATTPWAALHIAQASETSSISAGQCAGSARHRRAENSPGDKAIAGCSLAAMCFCIRWCHGNRDLR